jgi:hypothetical protein
MTFTKLLNRLPSLLILAALGFAMTGCSMMNKRQNVEQRPSASSYWQSSRYDSSGR